MILTHKIRLVPTKDQENYLRKTVGVARFTYNWALQEYKKQLDNGEKPNIYTIKRNFNNIKHQQFPWITEVTKCASDRPFLNLKDAFDRFFKKQNKFPKFHKKGKNDSFYIQNDTLQLKSKRVRIPKLGWVKLREYLRFRGKICSATVSRTGKRWFISIPVNILVPFKSSKSQGTIGIDLGIKHFAVLSDGTVIEAPKSLKKYQKKLNRLNRRLSRTKKGSNNRKKAIKRLTNCYFKITSIRDGFLHKLTTHLAKTYKTIVIEDLAVQEMQQAKWLAKEIQDLCFSKFKEQLKYKTKIYKTTLIIANRYFPSSKTCSVCGKINKNLKLSDRTFKCNCGNVLDRDLNAAINLKNYTEGSSEINACGQDQKMLDKAGSLHGNNFVRV